MKRFFRSEHLLLLVGLTLFGIGSYLGLVEAPPERYMGEVGRILYIHVPTAWIGLLTFTLAFVFAILILWLRELRWDDALVGLLEVGVVFASMLLIQGSIWAKPTWGVFWTWDPRLTTSAIMLVSFLGVLALRAFVKDPPRRARWTAVGTIIAFIDVPIVYFSIKWWRTLHQPFSSPETVASSMVWPMRINAVALLAIAAWLVIRRARLARARRRALETAAPAPSNLMAGD
jgi:heme exporter protein C